jgi:demethylmenaquinone methyltransferase/2-methoxy-6-polyprenyl-1,4-benzoquinol methylase
MPDASVTVHPRPLPPHPDLPKYYNPKAGKRDFVRKIFDDTAPDYDNIERLIGLGSGSWYRRRALERAGLTHGQLVLDVAIGTGLVAREACTITGSRQLVVGLDPSPGMLELATGALGIRPVVATGERIPFADNAFDFLSMGYALRHLSDLSITFAEFHRVLRPGGRLCILEITKPAGRAATLLLKFYMRSIVPGMARIIARRRSTSHLWTYYWDTIAACVPPAAVQAALANAGFANVARHVELGIFSEYTATKPAAPVAGQTVRA